MSLVVVFDDRTHTQEQAAVFPDFLECRLRSCVPLPTLHISPPIIWIIYYLSRMKFQEYFDKVIVYRAFLRIGKVIYMVEVCPIQDGLREPDISWIN